MYALLAESNTGWAIGYVIGIAVVLVVVALVVPILLLAHSIGGEAEHDQRQPHRVGPQHRGAGRAEHDDRVRRGDHGRAAPRPPEAGRLTMTLRTDLHAGEPVVGRGHRRLRRGAGGGRAAHDPRRAGAHDRPPGRRRSVTPCKQAADQHRRHGADRRHRGARRGGAGRGPRAPLVPRPCARKGADRDHASRALRDRDRTADRRPGVLSVRRRIASSPGSPPTSRSATSWWPRSSATPR